MRTPYKVFCFDLDGTVYHGTNPVEEAVELIGELQRQGIEPYYITNNSSATRKEVQQKLKAFGIQTKPEQIMTSAIAAAQYCRDHFQGKTVQLIGEKGLEEAIETAGMTAVAENGEVVVLGIDRAITYEKLAAACLAIRAGAPFIATNEDKAIPTERGLLPGAGSFAKLVEYSTGVAPKFLGKPEAYLLQMIQERSGCTKEEMILIGDNYDTDIQAGIRYGIATAHVAGGVTSLEEILMKKEQPTYLLAELSYEMLKKHLNKVVL